MPKWLKKAFVTLVTVVTLGTVVPSINTVPRENPKTPNLDVQEQSKPLGSQEQRYDVVIETKETRRKKNWATIVTETQDQDQLLSLLSNYAAEEAKEQGIKKFGQTIENKIGDTYTKAIVPKFGEAVTSFVKNADYETLINLNVSHNPAAGSGERILHIFDERTGEDLIKFHVRRDHPPLDGYWFNFHYHTAADNFQNHYEIGKIYWDKNMPPGWMA